MAAKPAEPPSTPEELLRRAEAMVAEGQAFAVLRIAADGASDAERSLVAAVDATQQALRPGDISAPTEDGDLCILAPGLTAEGGLELARRVAGAGQGVAGVAVFPDHGRDPGNLVALADEALFAARAANELAALPPSVTRSGRS